MNQELPNSQSATVSLDILLPQSVKAFIDEQVANGVYSTPGELVCDLVREARERAENERLEKLLLEALDSGKPIKVTPEYWEKKRAELLAKYGSENKAA